MTAPEELSIEQHLAAAAHHADEIGRKSWLEPPVTATTDITQAIVHLVAAIELVATRSHP